VEEGEGLGEVLCSMSGKESSYFIRLYILIQ
jgi:hypothetical protein